MCMHPHKDWWLPQDFMKSELGEFFVGYEASARLSELAKLYPDMFESRKHGRFYQRRIKFDEGRIWYTDLPDDMKRIIKKYLTEKIPQKPEQERLI